MVCLCQFVTVCFNVFIWFSFEAVVLFYTGILIPDPFVAAFERFTLEPCNSWITFQHKFNIHFQHVINKEKG